MISIARPTHRSQFIQVVTLIESTAGNFWLLVLLSFKKSCINSSWSIMLIVFNQKKNRVGTSVEHNTLYQYELASTRDLFMGFIQTETP
jgi:hypothetical protein